MYFSKLSVKGSALDIRFVDCVHFSVLHNVTEGHPVLLLVIANVHKYIIQVVELVGLVVASCTTRLAFAYGTK